MNLTDKEGKGTKIIVTCFLLVYVLVRGGMLTMTGSSRRKM
jgi:hypothetical protein